MTSRKLALAAAVVAALVAPNAAHAATITFGGTTYTYAGEGAEANSVIVSYTVDDTYGPMLQFQDSGATITYPTAQCLENSGGFIACVYNTAVDLRLEGNAGNDQLSIVSDEVVAMPLTMLGGDGDDQLKDSPGNTARRTLDGGLGNDELIGYTGEEVLLGGEGNDKLTGHGGADELRGGGGDDELYPDLYDPPAADIVDGGSGFDSVNDWSDPAGNNHPPVNINQQGAADDGRPGEGDNVTGIEKIVSHVNGTFEGLPTNDDILVWANTGPGASTIRGNDGDDKLGGLDQQETIDGGAGVDTITGGFGNDTLTGGPGKDTIFADDTGNYCGIYSCQLPYGNDTVFARDGEVDSIDCGVGADTVQADANDVVAPNCETVDRPPAGTGGTTAIAPSTVKFAFVGRRSLRALLASGLRFRVTCPAACEVTGELLLRGRRIATGRRTRINAGTVSVNVKASKAGKRALRRLRRAKLTLRVRIKDGASGRTSTFSKTLTLKR